MDKRICSIDGCTNPHLAKGYCNAHWKKWKRHGDPLWQRPLAPERKCTVNGCENKYHAQGYCPMHYLRAKADGKLSTSQECTVGDCRGYQVAKGVCHKHYQKLLRYGDPEVSVITKSATPGESLDLRTMVAGECLVWTGNVTEFGYGHMSVKGKMKYAHRVAWELARGPIPNGMQIDHICWNRACVNVDHLRLATQMENTQYLSGALPGSATGVRNVHPNGSGFIVRITCNKQRYSFGTYPTIDEAATVAERERARLFGDFAGRG